MGGGGGVPPKDVLEHERIAHEIEGSKSRARAGITGVERHFDADRGEHEILLEIAEHAFPPKRILQFPLEIHPRRTINGTLGFREGASRLLLLPPRQLPIEDGVSAPLRNCQHESLHLRDSGIRKAVLGEIETCRILRKQAFDRANDEIAREELHGSSGTVELDEEIACNLRDDRIIHPQGFLSLSFLDGIAIEIVRTARGDSLLHPRRRSVVEIEVQGVTGERPSRNRSEVRGERPPAKRRGGACKSLLANLLRHAGATTAKESEEEEEQAGDGVRCSHGG
jgi:hypothetical protein